MSMSPERIRQDGSLEPALVTSGDDVAHVARFLPAGASTGRAKDVSDYLLNGVLERCGTTRRGSVSEGLRVTTRLSTDCVGPCVACIALHRLASFEAALISTARARGRNGRHREVPTPGARR